MCQCKIWQAILLLIIVVFTFLDSTVIWLPSKWLVLIAVLALVIHLFVCKCCCSKKVKIKKPKKKRRR